MPKVPGTAMGRARSLRCRVMLLCISLAVVAPCLPTVRGRPPGTARTAPVTFSVPAADAKDAKLEDPGKTLEVMDRVARLNEEVVRLYRLGELDKAIEEYRRSFLRAKVAVVDERWATVGSSNIDPYSLLLAREANVIVHDPGFARQLAGVLEEAITHQAHRIAPPEYERRGWIARARDWCAYFVVRLATVVLARGQDY